MEIRTNALQRAGESACSSHNLAVLVACQKADQLPDPRCDGSEIGAHSPPPVAFACSIKLTTFCET
jgi:hypothetical protein